MMWHYVKTVITYACFAAIYATPVHAQSVSELSEIEQQLVHDAIKTINQQKQEKKGTLERVLCSYKIAGEKPVAATIKTHYSDYRKKPDCKEYSFIEHTTKTPDCVIEITSKSYEKDQLILVCKKNKKRQYCKYIDLP